MTKILGHTTYGSGASRVLVLHDWFGDCRIWEPAKPYLTADRFTYAFADLRGYGRSKDIVGRFSLDEAITDVIALVDHLQWTKFAIVGHSMTTVLAQRLAQLAPQRLERAILVTPVSPTSMQLDANALAGCRGLAMANDEQRFGGAKAMWGDRLSDTWIKYKLDHWRDAAAPEAVASYVDMWGKDDVSAGVAQVKAPLLMITCEQDQPPFRTEPVDTWRRKYYPQAKLVSIDDSGHYPMQETPPLFASLVERFINV